MEYAIQFNNDNVLSKACSNFDEEKDVDRK
jgi:hypothetical protein